MHRANAAAVDALYPGCHLIMNVTGFEHRSGLIFPVHRPQPAFDSALAVPKNFGVISFHSKGPFVELFSVMTNSFQPTFTGLSSFFFKTDQKITLVDGLGIGFILGRWQARRTVDGYIAKLIMPEVRRSTADFSKAAGLLKDIHAGNTNDAIESLERELDTQILYI